MTKGELIDKVEDYNTAAQAAYYRNLTSGDMKQCIDNLKLVWTTDHGEEILAEMDGIFQTMEDAMNAMDAAMQAAKNCYINISFHTETHSSTTTSGGGGS